MIRAEKSQTVTNVCTQMLSEGILWVMFLGGAAAKNITHDVFLTSLACTLTNQLLIWAIALKVGRRAG
jgi:hypothetical protein